MERSRVGFGIILRAFVAAVIMGAAAYERALSGAAHYAAASFLATIGWLLGIYTAALIVIFAMKTLKS